MPELPDLKVYAKNIKKLILDKTISNITVYRAKNLDSDADIVMGCLIGAEVSDVYAEGKELFIAFSNSNKISIHLMKYGRCLFVSKAECDDIKRKIFGISFESGECFVVEDFRCFCKISLNPLDSDVPDVLSSEFTFEYFLQKIEQYKRKNVKAFLLDQKIMRGIGNAYADEILWEAKISPKSIIGKIPVEVQKILYKSIGKVILWAVAEIKKINPNMINGELRDFMRVHNPLLEYSQDGEQIHTEVISSKNTFFTDSQVIYD